MKIYRTILLLSAIISSPGSFADVSHWEQAQWDLGIGLGGFRYELYAGSRDTDSFVLPIPYFTYISPILEIDRGIKGFLYNSEHIALDISADFALPVDSSDSRLRQGMPDLDAVLQLGPSVEWLLSAAGDDLDVRLELPLRVAVSTDIKDTRHAGWLIEPRFSIEHRRQAKQGLSYKLTSGLSYATRDYHAYYYDVQPAYVTAQRTAYTADKGYGGAFISLRGSYRIDDWVFWLYARYTNIGNAMFADSPLVETDQHSFIGAGFSWIFAQNL